MKIPAGQPYSIVNVVLRARTEGRQGVLYSKTMRVGSGGSYTFTDVAPGEYLIFATTRVANPFDEFARRLADVTPEAQRIHVERRATVNASLTLLDEAQVLVPASR